MKMNNMEVVQVGEAAYAVFTPHGYQIALIQCPPNGQKLEDCKAMDLITRVLALRYQFIQAKGKSTYR